MTQPAGQSPYNPLCTSESLQKLYEIGKRYDQKYGATHWPNWDAQVAALRQDALRGEAYIGYSSVAHVASLVLDAVSQQLTTCDDGRPTFLKEQIRDLQQAQERMYTQLIQGNVPEFESYINQIVERKIQEMAPLQQQEEQEEESADIRQVKQLTQDALQAFTNIPNEVERQTRIRQTLQQIQTILSRREMRSDKDEIIQRMVTLVQAMLLPTAT